MVTKRTFPRLPGLFSEIFREPLKIMNYPLMRQNCFDMGSCITCSYSDLDLSTMYVTICKYFQGVPTDDSGKRGG